jgi:ketosteroid isomerase-like protein
MMMSTAALQGQVTGNAPISQDESDIRALIARMPKALYSKDAAAFVAQYTPDAAVCNLAPPLVHHGVKLEEKQAWFDTWDGPIELEARDFQVAVSGDLAFCHGFYRMSGTPTAAGRPISFWMRETLCVRRDTDGWRIVHEHTSVPFYMDGGLRPAFDLNP